MEILIDFLLLNIICYSFIFVIHIVYCFFISILLFLTNQIHIINILYFKINFVGVYKIYISTLFLTLPRQRASLKCFFFFSSCKSGNKKKVQVKFLSSFYKILNYIFLFNF